MTATITATREQNQQPFLVTKTGNLKSRFSAETKLEMLDPASSLETTRKRLVAFRKLFAFRYTDAGATLVGQPRSWWTMKVPLTDEDIVRHLLADRIPTQKPKWFSARSFSCSYWLCIDVDAERTKEQQLADEYEVDRMDAETKRYFLDRQPPPVPKPSLDSRCQQVEQAFARMGINSRKRNEVLVQRTPSGGFHYYLFFDNAYFVEQYRQLLLDAGLYHKPGEFELFPSTNQGLRLPFGHIPGRPDRPDAWIEFIDRYRFGRIKRHSLEELNERLFEGNYVPTTVASQPQTPTTKKQSSTTKLGTPKNDRRSASSTKDFGVEKICSIQEAEELMAVGIQAKGTRNHVLNQLAAHLIWFKNKSAEEAAATLAAWALDPRHNSEDIAYDLANGTDRVEKQIHLMCRWYETNNNNNNNEVISAKGKEKIRLGKFSMSEIKALRNYLAQVPEQEKIGKAQFVLHLLNFSKRHGRNTDDNLGWESSPAVNAIIRPWPGCHHMNYKPKMDWAVEIGLIEMTKDKWHRPNGKGRARTYRINVAPDLQETNTIDYESALNYLTNSDSLDIPVEKRSQLTGTENPITVGEPNATKQNTPDHESRQGAIQFATTLRPKSTERHVGTRTHQRDQKRDEAANLHGKALGRLSTDSTRSRQRRNSVDLELTLQGFIDAEHERLASTNPLSRC